SCPSAGVYPIDCCGKDAAVWPTGGCRATTQPLAEGPVAPQCALAKSLDRYESTRNILGNKSKTQRPIGLSISFELASGMVDMGGSLAHENSLPAARGGHHIGLVFALVTTAFWGVWGAFAGRPAENGFPETLIYVVWSLTMIVPALYALARIDWKPEHDHRAIVYGALIGLTGAGGQMLLFHAVRTGPTYLIFPLIALSPVVTIALSAGWLHERV